MKTLLVLLFGFAVIGVAAHAQSSGRTYPPTENAPLFRAFMSADSGYLIENPQLIAGSEVTQVSVSDDRTNGYVLAIQRQRRTNIRSIEDRWADSKPNKWFSFTADDFSLVL